LGEIFFLKMVIMGLVTRMMLGSSVSCVGTNFNVVATPADLDRLLSIHLCRFACPGEGLPPDIVQDMFSNARWTTQEGIGLSVCRKILKLMGGEVQYIRESERSFFLIVLELPQPRRSDSRDQN
jgi:hypothetical protein